MQNTACFGYAFQPYAQAKVAGIVDTLAAIVRAAAPGLMLGDSQPIVERLRATLDADGQATSCTVDEVSAFVGELAQGVRSAMRTETAQA